MEPSPSPLHQARELYDQGRLAEAIEVLRGVEASSQDAPLTWSYLVGLYVETGNYLAAVRCAERLALAFPEDHLHREGYAYTLVKVKRLADAEVQYRKAIDLAPDCHHHLFSLGVVLRRLHKFDEALVYLHRAVEYLPDNADVWNSLGTTYHSKKDWENAKLYYQKALEVDPLHELARLNVQDVEDYLAGKGMGMRFFDS